MEGRVRNEGMIIEEGIEEGWGRDGKNILYERAACRMWTLQRNMNNKSNVSPHLSKVSRHLHMCIAFMTPPPYVRTKHVLSVHTVYLQHNYSNCPLISHVAHIIAYGITIKYV